MSTTTTTVATEVPKCAECDGHGTLGLQLLPCFDCKGTGRATLPQQPTDFAAWLARVPELGGFSIGAKGWLVWSAAQQAAAHPAPTAQAAPSAPVGSYVLMPTGLTAENGAKAELSGEFSESLTVKRHECEGVGEVDDGYECAECKGEGTVEQPVMVEWDTIKRIYARAVALLGAPTSTDSAAPTREAVSEMLHRALDRAGIHVARTLVDEYFTDEWNKGAKEGGVA